MTEDEKIIARMKDAVFTVVSPPDDYASVLDQPQLPDTAEKP